MTLPDVLAGLDLEHGRLLLNQYNQASLDHRAWPTTLEIGPVLKVWLLDNANALIGAAEELGGTRLQVESRDRTIKELLRTLADTEARLPGITRKP